jgi:hypothetical protein
MLKTAEVLNYGVTVVIIMESTGMDKNTERACITGQTVQSTLETGNKMKCTVAENLYGRTVGSTKANSLWA